MKISVLALIALALGSGVAMGESLDSAYADYEEAKKAIDTQIAVVRKFKDSCKMSGADKLMLPVKLSLIDGALDKHIGRVADVVGDLEAGLALVGTKSSKPSKDCNCEVSTANETPTTPSSGLVDEALAKLKTYKSNFVKDSKQVLDQKNKIAKVLSDKSNPDCVAAQKAFENGISLTASLPSKMDALIAAVKSKK